MDDKKLNEYKELLLQHKMRILNGDQFKHKDDLFVAQEDLPDEADLAASVISQQVTFNLRHREMMKLRAIEEALMRIEEGEFGHCEECGESIGEKKLKNQPWTILCITHAEEKEREESQIQRYVGQ